MKPRSACNAVRAHVNRSIVKTAMTASPGGKVQLAPIVTGPAVPATRFPVIEPAAGPGPQREYAGPWRSSLTQGETHFHDCPARCDHETIGVRDRYDPDCRDRHEP